MSNSSELALKFDMADSIDPRVTPVNAPKGTLYRYIPRVGAAEALQKQDNGSSTNWTVVGGGGTPTGPANSLAFFDGTGTLIGDGVKAVFDPLTSYMSVVARADFASGVTVAGPAAFVHAYLDNAASIDASGSGCFVSGFFNQGSVNASTNGAVVFGATAAGSLVSAGTATFVSGFAQGSGAMISATGFGAAAFGWADIAAAGALPEISAQGPGSMAHGKTRVDGAIIASSNGSHAGGYAAGNLGFKAYVRAVGVASFAHGWAGSNSAIIEASERGSQAFGYANANDAILRATGVASSVRGNVGISSVIEASGLASVASGNAINSGSILTDVLATASHASGFADGGIISTMAEGAFVHGYVTGAGLLKAAATGAIAFGSVSGGGIQSVSDGAFAYGYNLGGGITASGSGAFAGGHNEGGSIISAGTGSFTRGYSLGVDASLYNTASGSFVGGFADGSAALSVLECSGNGSFVHGYVNGGILRVIGEGSAIFGYSGNSFTIQITGNACYAFGKANSGDTSVNGENTFVLGDNLTVDGIFNLISGRGLKSQAGYVTIFGKYNVEPVAAGWDSVAPLFILGNGANDGNRSNAYQVDKDGRQTTTASQVDKSIKIVDSATDPNYTVNARTDHTLILDVTASNMSVTFPPAEDGLEFEFKKKDNTSTGNTVTFVPDGADIINPGDLATMSNFSTDFAKYKCYQGVWYGMYWGPF
jgi:hypothetical protein